MEILSYGIVNGDIEGLWIIMIFVSVITLVCAVLCSLDYGFGKVGTIAIILSILFVGFGIFGLSSLTPRHNFIKVSTKQAEFDINSVMDKYDITDVDGYIITLEEKEPNN